MALLHKLLFSAARRLATDERARKLAADTYRDTVKPRAEAAWKSAKPRIDETKADIGKIAEETDAKNHPAEFAGRATRRIIDELKGSKKNP